MPPKKSERYGHMHLNLSRCALILILTFALGNLASTTPRAEEDLVTSEFATAEFDRRALARLADPPLGLPPVPITDQDTPTTAKIALGRKLLFDRRLSLTGTLSCAACHIPEQGFTSNETKTPVGAFGLAVRRNAPTLLNVAYQGSLFHDGRETALKTQVIAPLLARNEMANPSPGFLIARIKSLDDYRGRFEEAFGKGPNIDRLGRAIAAYERTLLSANSPFDRWYFGGQKDAMNEAAKAGFALFKGKAGCIACHKIAKENALFTDQKFHFTGIAYRSASASSKKPSLVTLELTAGVSLPLGGEAIFAISGPRALDLGRYEVTLDPDDTWSYKTPSLRNVALTAPYMHDGSIATLRDVVAFYNYPGLTHPRLDSRIQPLALTLREVEALVAFLESLTGDNLAELIADARSQPAEN